MESFREGSCTVSIDEGSCHVSYIESGDPESEVAVFLFHGWPGVADEFVPFMTEMSLSFPHVRCISPCAPGYFPSGCIIGRDRRLVKSGCFRTNAKVYMEFVRSFEGIDMKRSLCVGSDAGAVSTEILCASLGWSGGALFLNVHVRRCRAEMESMLSPHERMKQHEMLAYHRRNTGVDSSICDLYGRVPPDSPTEEEHIQRLSDMYLDNNCYAVEYVLQSWNQGFRFPDYILNALRAALTHDHRDECGESLTGMNQSLRIYTSQPYSPYSKASGYTLEPVFENPFSHICGGTDGNIIHIESIVAHGEWIRQYPNRVEGIFVKGVGKHVHIFATKYVVDATMNLLSFLNSPG